MTVLCPGRRGPESYWGGVEGEGQVTAIKRCLSEALTSYKECKA